jgi:hypothetical protein
VIAPESELDYGRFETKNYTFIYPKSWEYTTATDGTVRFVEKSDEERRVFLTFGVEQVAHQDKRSDPNVLIANLAGIKKTKKDELDRDRQEIMLFSNASDRKYSFEFISGVEEFEKKKYFSQLLNSFLEGEENVKNAKEEDLKKLAVMESGKGGETQIVPYEVAPTEENIEPVPAPEEVIKEEIKEEPKESLESVETPVIELPENLLPDEDQLVEPVGTEEKKGFFERLFGSDESEEVVVKTPETIPPETKTTTQNTPGNFNNMLDARSYSYQAELFDLSLKIPYGHWFQNFGASGTALMRLGISKKAINSESDPVVWFKIIEGSQTGFSEKCNDTCVIAFPRDDSTHFEIKGDKVYRDLMLSIWSSL